MILSLVYGRMKGMQNQKQTHPGAHNLHQEKLRHERRLKDDLKDLAKKIAQKKKPDSRQKESLNAKNTSQAKIQNLKILLEARKKLDAVKQKIKKSDS